MAPLSWTLSLGVLALAVVLLAAAPAVLGQRIPPDQYDLAMNYGDATPPTRESLGPFSMYVWTYVNANAQAGFCLTPEQGRIISNLSNPLYTRPVTLAYFASFGVPTIIEWVTKLLLQEVIGYTVMDYGDEDLSALATGTYSRTMTRLPVQHRADAYVYVGINLADPQPEYQAVDGKSILSRGVHSVLVQQGIYVRRHTILAHPELGLGSWTSWGVGPNPYGENPPPPSFQQSVRDLFITDTWDTLTPSAGVNYLLNNPWAPTSGYICQGTMMSLTGASILTGCDDPAFPGMYIPPQCYPNPRQQCALVYAFQPNIDPSFNGFIQPQVRNLNLSLAVAYISFALLGDPTFHSQAPGSMFEGKNLLMWFDSSMPEAFYKCSQTDGSSRNCWHRLQLPVYDASCDEQWNGNYDSNYACDFPTQSIVKMSGAGFAAEAHRADFLIAKMSLGPSDLDFFYTALSAPDVLNPADYKGIACAWLQNPANQARWLTWISPPPACSEGDTSFTIGDCDLLTATRPIVYSWNLPKACAGGRALPAPESLTCGFVTAGWFMGTCFAVVFALVLLAVVIWYSRLLYIRRERILRDAKDTAEKASLMKSEFLATMSHEIRTPLNGIIGNAQLLRMTGMTLEQSEYAHQIEDSSTHLLTVINDILHVSRLDAGGVELEDVPFELSSCIEQAIHLGFKSGQDDAFEVFYFLDPRLPQFIRGDSTRLRQILVNLLGNALKFSKETKRGQVVVYARILCLPTPAPPLLPPVSLAAKFRSKLSRNDSFHVWRPSASVGEDHWRDDSAVLNSCRARRHTGREREELHAGSTSPGGGGGNGAVRNSLATPVLPFSLTPPLVSVSDPLAPAALQPMLPVVLFSPVTPVIGSSTQPPPPPQAEHIQQLTRSIPAPLLVRQQTQLHMDCVVTPKPPRGALAPIPEQALRALAPGELLLEFEVEDCGCGIPADKQDKLFKAFSQVDSSISRTHGGTGLGLSISLGLTKLMGGKLRVRSEVKKGSSFFFTVITRDGAAATDSTSTECSQAAFCTDDSASVPTMNAAATMTATPAIPTRCFLGARQLVILVHENLAFHAAMAAQFSRWKLSLLCATSPDEVLEWLSGSAHRPELDQDDLPVRFPPAVILCDTFFPGSPGRLINASLFALELTGRLPEVPSVQLMLLQPSNLIPDPMAVTPRGSRGSMRDLWAAARPSPSAHLMHLDGASIERLFVRSIRKPVMFKHLYRVLWGTLQGDTPPALKRNLNSKETCRSPTARSSGNALLPVHSITEEKEQATSSDEQLKSNVRVVAPIVVPTPIVPASSSVTPASAASADVWSPLPSAGSLLPLRILIADDDSTNRKLLRRCLLKLGYDSSTLSIAHNIQRCSELGVSIASTSVSHEQSAASKKFTASRGALSPTGDVECAEDGLEAVVRLKACHADLVLMDMQMPKCSGIEATQRILAWYRSDFPSEMALHNTAPRPVLPYVVALTANVLGEHKQQCFDAGMSSFMTKPFTIKALATMIAAAGQQLYAQHRSQREHLFAPSHVTCSSTAVGSTPLLPVSPSPHSASPLLSSPAPVSSSFFSGSGGGSVLQVQSFSSTIATAKHLLALAEPAPRRLEQSASAHTSSSSLSSARRNRLVLLHRDSPLSRACASTAPQGHDRTASSSCTLGLGLGALALPAAALGGDGAASTKRRSGSCDLTTYRDGECVIEVQDFHGMHE